MTINNYYLFYKTSLNSGTRFYLRAIIYSNDGTQIITTRKKKEAMVFFDMQEATPLQVYWKQIEKELEIRVLREKIEQTEI